MSSAARITIGIAALAGAICFFLIGMTIGRDGPNGPWPFYILAAFCGLTVFACFVKRSRSIALRLIGLAVFVVYAGYFVSAWKGGLRDAAVGFFVWGLPAGYLAFVGRYPMSAPGYAAFSGSENSDPAAAATSDFERSESARPTDSGDVNRAAARRFGFATMLSGIALLILPFFGLALRQLGNMGTRAVGTSFLVLGFMAFLASLNKNLNSFAEIITKAALYLVLAIMLLIVISSGVAIIYLIWLAR